LFLVFRLLLKTPRLNLARGMQRFLSAYALWDGRRRQRAGHVFQGRYRAAMIEDESYYGTVSRYIHLNPVRARLVARPKDWLWSSYPGYADSVRRFPWVASEVLLRAWSGEYGGTDPAKAYRKYVDAGVLAPPTSPFREAFGGWVLGSAGFVTRLGALAGPVTADPPLPEARQLAGMDPRDILEAVAQHSGLEVSPFARRGDPHRARALAAWLCRRHCQVPLRSLAPRFGMSRADSMPNLTRRVDTHLQRHPVLAYDLDRITKKRHEKTENKVRPHDSCGRGRSLPGAAFDHSRRGDATPRRDRFPIYGNTNAK
jgi:putative transposase